MRLLLALLVVAVLLVLGDRLAVGFAERRVADDLQRSQGLDERPEVRIGGVPFLTQAVAGEYRDVTVSATGLDLGRGFRAQRVDARLRGVRVPLEAALQGAPARVPADRVEARALVGFDELESTAAPDAVDSLELAAGSADDEVRVQAVVTVLGRELTLVSDSKVAVDGQQVRVTADDVGVAGDDSGAAQAVLDALTGGELDLAVDVGELPFGLQLRDVQVTEQGLVAVVGGEDVVLERAP